MNLTTKKAYTKNTTLAAPLLGLSEYSKDSNFCVYLGFHAPIDDNETSELNDLFRGNPYENHWLAAADDIFFSPEWLASHHFKTNETFTGNQTLDLENYSHITIDKYGHIIELIEKEIKYYISWNDNGATSAHSGGSMAVLKGEKVTLPTTSPTRSYSITWNLQSGTAGSTEGTTSVTYGFKGWYTAASGGTKITNQTQPTATSTYYAQWNTQDPSSITVPSNPTRSGYTFLGWFTAKSGGTQVTTGNRSITANTTFYAQWKNNTVYYWYVGSTKPVSSSDVTSSGWTKLNSKPSQIDVNTDMVIPPVVWYVAIPHEYGFQPYDSTGGAPDSAGWTKSQVTIQNVSYDVFTLNGSAPRVNSIYKV